MFERNIRKVKDIKRDYSKYWIKEHEISIKIMEISVLFNILWSFYFATIFY